MPDGFVLVRPSRANSCLLFAGWNGGRPVTWAEMREGSFESVSKLTFMCHGCTAEKTLRAVVSADTPDVPVAIVCGSEDCTSEPCDDDMFSNSRC